MNWSCCWEPECWPVIFGGATGWLCGAGFFFESLYSVKVPKSGTVLRFLAAGMGLEPALSRCSVLPFRSTGWKR